jgi:Tol biopolymer transport system component
MRLRPVLYAGLFLLLASACGGSGAHDEQGAAQGVIAYVVNREGLNEIWTMRPDGSRKRRLTRAAPADRLGPSNQQPSWSPSGDAIAYVSARSSHENGFEIWTMRPDGSRKHRLTSNRVADLQPGWSPAGEQLLFVREPTSTSAAIYAMNQDGTDQHELAREVPERGAVFLHTPTWSPDGLTIAYTRYALDDRLHLAIYAMDTDGTNRRELIADAADPAWSPDGSMLAFVSDRDHNGRCLFHECSGFANELYVARADGSDARRVTRTRAVEETPTWSPDGTRIAFSRVTNENTGYDIYTIRPSGTGLRRITRRRGHEWHYQPSWGS